MRPLPLIIFTANFLPDHGIAHIEETEKKAAQMGKVSDAPSRSPHRRKEFDEAENDHHVFSWHGEEEID